MTKGLGSAHFQRLALLQDLAALDKRRTLELACATTDDRSKDVRTLTRELAAAQTNLDDVYGAGRLCIDSLTVAGAILSKNANALVTGQQELATARMSEEQAAQNWMAARHRTEWFDDKARTLRRKEGARRDDAAEFNARTLRLAMRGNNAS